MQGRVRDERVWREITGRAHAVAYARELCGCWSCWGGHEIGPRTLGMAIGAQRSERPSSCLAAVILADLLAETRETGDTPPGDGGG